MKKKDIIIIAAVVVAAAILFVVGRGLMAPKDAGTVVIYVGNDVYQEVPLGEEQVITVEQAGHRNEIHIDEHGAYMQFSTCENQQCVGQGEATIENYETRILGGWIICLPNGVSIELIPPGEAGQ